MHDKERRRYHLAIVGLLTALVFTLTGFAIAEAVVDAGNGATNACYNTRNGRLRANINGCRATETGRVLGGPNQLPPSYAKVWGVPAPVGANPGTSIIDVDIASAGTYVVSGQVSLQNEGGDVTVVTCRLRSSDGSSTQSTVDFLDPGEVRTIATTARLTVATGGEFRMQCYENIWSGDVSANTYPGTGGSITAVRVST
jgi:hypothetical protein